MYYVAEAPRRCSEFFSQSCTSCTHSLSNCDLVLADWCERCKPVIDCVVLFCSRVLNDVLALSAYLWNTFVMKPMGGLIVLACIVNLLACLSIYWALESNSECRHGRALGLFSSDTVFAVLHLLFPVYLQRQVLKQVFRVDLDLGITPDRKIGDRDLHDALKAVFAFDVGVFFYVMVLLASVILNIVGVFWLSDGACPGRGNPWNSLLLALFYPFCVPIYLTITYLWLRLRVSFGRTSRGGEGLLAH